MSEPTLADLEKRVAALEDRIMRFRKSEKGKPIPVVPFIGEKQLKEWVSEESTRAMLSNQAIYVRVLRGQYPELKIRRVNKRVVFVSRKTT